MVTTKILPLSKSGVNLAAPVLHCNKQLATPRGESLTCNIDHSIICIVTKKKKIVHTNNKHKKG